MKPRRYTQTAMLIHWAQAAVVLWLLWRGWSMIDLPKGAERTAAYERSEEKDIENRKKLKKK